MDKIWHGLVKIGIIHPMAFPSTIKGEGPVLETITKIANDEFFDAIEIRRVPIADGNLRDEVKKILITSGITVVLAGQPPLLIGKLNLNSEDEVERKKAIDDVKLSVDEAEFFRAKRVVILSGPNTDEGKREKAKSVLVESLIEICKYAKEKNIEIALETFDFNIDKKCLIGSTKEAVEIAKKVKKTSSNFGLAIDLSHLPLLNEKSIDTLILAKDYLTHVHVGNCILKDKSHAAYGDNHPRFGINGGENDIAELSEFLRALFKIGYLKNKPIESPNIVSFEVKPVLDESSESVIANAKRAWQKAWSLV